MSGKETRGMDWRCRDIARFCEMWVDVCQVPGLNTMTGRRTKSLLRKEQLGEAYGEQILARESLRSDEGRRIVLCW